MTNEQWHLLLAAVDGNKLNPMPVGFIIDSPWLPGWYGTTTLDYYTSEKIWLHANLKAIETFPDIIFLPGFWSEFGMCGEPSAFGSKPIWSTNNLPHAEKIISDPKHVTQLSRPNVKSDGLLPFIIRRLVQNQDTIRQSGHEIKFAVSRGPLNIASFLMGTTEFMMATQTHPEETHKLLSLISEFIVDWLTYQTELFPTIDGIFLLDDLVGFLGEKDFKIFALPFLKKIYNSFSTRVKFFHNDAAGLVSAPYLGEIGINLFNFSFNHGLEEMKNLTDNSICLLGNIPPVEIMAQGSEADVRNAVREALDSVKDNRRIILSCGGGMPPGVDSGNIQAFRNAVYRK